MKIATFFEAENDKSLRTKDNAPFGGWEHYDYREAKEQAQKLAFDNRFNFINDIKLKSTDEVIKILIKGLTETRELYCMTTILYMKVVEPVRYRFKSEIDTIGYDRFLQRTYPTLMNEIKNIRARYYGGKKYGQPFFGVLLSDYSKEELINLKL